MLDDGVIVDSNDVRFHKKNNLILSRLGCEKKLLTIDFNELDIDKVDYLFLFSDGITDCISDSTLEKIIRRKYKNVSNVIMREVLTKNSYSGNLNLDEYYDKIEAGKDNASIICKRRI